ncbi:MAG: Fic family protein, partial [Chloroflexi bacterium]|nr:Fic family protein [Chloroflexota bacterium]
MAADERDDNELMLDGVSAQARALARLRPLPQGVVARLGGVLRADELEAIYTSNAIEGSTLTLRETELVVEQGITIGGKPLKDHLAAVNLAAALQQIKGIAGRGSPLTETMALDLHRIVLARIDDANAGRYRRDAARIVGATHA